MAIKLLSTLEAAGDSAGAASSISDAQYVYTLASVAGVTVTVVDDDSGSTVVGSMKVPNGNPVVLKKRPNQELYASNASCHFTSVNGPGDV